MKITSHNADYDTLNNYYLLNYLAEFAKRNNKIDTNKSVIDEFINLSKIENNKSLAEDTSKSLLQRQVSQRDTLLSPKQRQGRPAL